MRYRKHTDAEDSWTTYWFEKNMFGDVVAVYSSAGTKLVSYKYDAWGNFTTTTHAADSVGGSAKNPFRYRGYYYDVDLGFYVTGTRYYDPAIGRFINADSVMSGASGSLQGCNLYAYCFNNPIMFTDENGNWAFLNAVEAVWEYYLDHSFIYNVIVRNIEFSAGVGVGMGVEVEVGPVEVQAISRVDAVGISVDDGAVKIGHIGESSLSVDIGPIYNVGANSSTFQSFDGTVFERDKSIDDELTIGLGASFGFVVSAHVNLSFSISGAIENLIYLFGK